MLKFKRPEKKLKLPDKTLLVHGIKVTVPGGAKVELLGGRLALDGVAVDYLPRVTSLSQIKWLES